MLRTLLIVILAPIVLSACSLPGTQSEGATTENNTVVYAGSGFTMNIPSTWKTSVDRPLPLPQNGTVVLTAISPDVQYGFSNNILIMEDMLNVPTTSKRYSELNQLQTTRNYLEYTKISDEPILFADDDTSTVDVFEARYNTTTQRMKFIQTAKVCGTKVYLLHAAISLDKDPTNYISLFRTFRCK